MCSASSIVDNKMRHVIKSLKSKFEFNGKISTESKMATWQNGDVSHFFY